MNEGLFEGFGCVGLTESLSDGIRGEKPTVLLG